jgi:energy-coupling factor transport system substrate-specific component
MRPSASAAQALQMTLIPIGIGLNLAMGTVIHALQLPLYLDAVGTIIVTLLVGLRSGLLTGVVGNFAAGLLISPAYPWFSATQAAIAFYTHLVAKRRAFTSLPRAAIAGVGLGFVSAAVSAPVIAYLFGGLTGDGKSLIAAYFLSTGRTLIKSVFLSGLASDPVDKTLQCVLAAWLLKGMPESLLARFRSLGSGLPF